MQVIFFKKLHLSETIYLQFCYFVYFQPCNLYFISIRHEVKWLSLRRRCIKSSKNILSSKQSNFLRYSWDMINSPRACILDFCLFLGLYLYIHNIEGLKGYSVKHVSWSIWQIVAMLWIASFWDLVLSSTRQYFLSSLGYVQGGTLGHQFWFLE